MSFRLGRRRVWLTVAAIASLDLNACQSTAISTIEVKDARHTTPLVAEGIQAMWEPFTLPDASQTLLHSAYTHKDYLIQTMTVGDVPKDGYAVLYVTDGNAFFAMAAAVAKMLHARPNQHNQPALLIVGIGYQTPKTFDIAQRTHDFTPPSASYPAPHGEQTRFGGADAFYGFIQQELRPLIGQRYAVNTAHESLFGHSYGGLFASYVLLNHPTAFRHYIIASPSLWWHNSRVLEDVPHLSARLVAEEQAGERSPSQVLITLGEHELVRQDQRYTTIDRQHRLTQRNMAAAADLAQQLSSHLPNTQVSYVLNHGKNHGSNAISSVEQAVTMVYQACHADTAC